MAHNRVPVIASLAIQNGGPARMGAAVDIAVHDGEGIVSRPCRLLVDLSESGITSIPDVSLQLDPGPMLQVNEQRPGMITVTVTHDGEPLAATRLDVQLLAARQWLATPPGLALELLASYVMPNDPAITPLIQEASANLAQRTGSPSIDGYQTSAERVDEVVRSICEAFRARNVAYSTPPASWADDGQKVRTPQEVIEGRIGTCLDTVLTLAAALEQSGIRPVIWVVEGHAFLGYWREEFALDATVDAAPLDVVNRIDLGEMRLIETTLLNARPETAPFDELHRSPYGAYLRGTLDKVIGVVDIWRARQNGIIPLPARRRTDEGVQVFEYSPAIHNDPTGIVVRGQARDAWQAGDAPEVPPRIQQWKNALLDLSLRNRLINFSERSSIKLVVPDGHLATIENIVNAGVPLHLMPSDQLDAIHGGRGIEAGAALPEPILSELLARRSAVYCDVPIASYATRMRNQAYKARTIVEETGANNLYLALGSLIWSLDERPLRSPLILTPVKLVSVSRSHLYRVELDESGASTPNYCLLEKLKQSFGLEIPGLANPAEDESGIDLDAAIEATRVAIRGKGLSFRVGLTAELAILQFAKFRLWKDLDEGWAQLMANSLVAHLVISPTEPYVDPVPATAHVDLDELDARCPIPADASQLEAVAEACAGRTFVLEGPPGTGKSQTITNLLTRAVADGKRVLFVAEKRAALDVVAERLDAVGMGPFSLDLHDKGAKPTVVRAQIKEALEHTVGVDEQGLAAQQETLRGARRNLLRYAQRLHEPNSAGLSYYSARTSLLTLGDSGASLAIPIGLLTPGATDTLKQIRAGLINLPDVADPARPAIDHPWGFVGPIPTESTVLESLRQAARSVDQSLQHLTPIGTLAAALRAVRTADDLAALAALSGSARPALDLLDETRTQRWREATATLTADIATFVATSHPGLDVATPSALDLPLAEFHAQAQSAEASFFFGRGKKRKAVLARLQPALRPGADIGPKRVLELTTALMSVQDASRQLARRAAAIRGIEVPLTWNPLIPTGREIVDRQVSWLMSMGQAVDEQRPGPFPATLRQLLNDATAVDPGEASRVQVLADAMRDLAQKAGGEAATFEAWSCDQGLLDRWATTSPSRDLSDESMLVVRRWLAFLDALTPMRAVGMHDAGEALRTGVVHADDAVQAFDRGLAAASLAERRQSTGLDVFDPLSHNRTVKRFIESTGVVRQQMTTVVPREVLDRRPFQANAATGQVGALQRELAKQRRGLGVRGLLETYGDLVTQLMPCVLVSPDSVARFFPVGGQIFDLVVFDEASQIRVADAVGAMGRSRSVVVVGDSKQMPPTSFAEPRIGGDDDAMPDPLVVEDEESILTESLQARVPRRWLTWHYRSQDESLISFSNRHYYEDKLATFPAPHNARAVRGAEGYGVSLVRVDGTFLRAEKGKLFRTNPVEAAAIVAEIRRRFAATPSLTPSIGVVTFNAQQRAHIEGLIRDTQDERLIAALDGTLGEGLFIKNLENVQGDERDVILFSTAFSINEKGILPLNFGPLNLRGGERRLNVAVTRARRQVIIFSSFDPGQLRAEETQSTGIKHLRAYLDMAVLGTAAMGPSVSQRQRLPDRHRDSVAEALRARGLVVGTDVGLSEFRIDLTLALTEEPDRPLVAVLLDGDGWFHRRTVGDRDGLPVQVLSKLMHWPEVERVWLPEWLSQPDAVVERLEQSTRAAAVRPPLPLVADSTPALPFGTSSTATEPSTPPLLQQSATPRSAVTPLREQAIASVPPSPMATAPAPSVARELPGETPFVPWKVRPLGSRELLDGLPAPYAAEKVRQALQLVVQTEGPVHVDRLARQVAAAFDLTRVSPSRVKSILAQLPPQYRRDHAELFAWPEGIDPLQWDGFRRAPESDPRPVDEVSLVEIGNAMAALCHASAGMYRAELLREVLTVFGGKRLTSGITARLELALSAALSHNVVSVTASGLVRPSADT